MRTSTHPSALEKNNLVATQKVVCIEITTIDMLLKILNPNFLLKLIVPKLIRKF